MRRYEDPEQHFERHMGQAAQRYADGLQQAGLEPSETLTRAMARRALQEARADYVRQATKTRNHNIALIQEQHRQRLNQIKRDGARLRLWTCPPITLVFGAVGYLCYVHGNPMGALINFLLAFVFLCFLVFGAIFDRPR